MTNDAQEREEIERMLPWYVAGTLNRRDASRVEAALGRDEILTKYCALVREELAETIHLNEAVSPPTARTMALRLAAIEARVAPRRNLASVVAAHAIVDRVSGLRPRTLAWSAIAAAAVIMIQAGLLAGLYVADRGGEARYETSSVPEAGTERGHVFIRFAPQATAGDVAKFLETNELAVIDGPRAGGLFKVRLAGVGVTREQLTRQVDRMRKDSKIVAFAAPTE